MTTLLDETEAPAQALAALYAQRWEIEAVFDGFGDHVLRAGA
ncbi:MAG: transposase [Burkholderiales bacterium]